MEEFWLISAPGEPTPKKMWEHIREKTKELSASHKFGLPEMQMAQYMADILGDEVKERLAENLLVGPNKLPMENFLTRFTWDGAKFPLRQPLLNIVEGLVSQIDGDLKQKSQAYNQLRQNLQAIERKETGNLMTRSLVDVVRKEHFVLNSEYLITLLVVVPKVMYKEWSAVYEKLTDMIVPRSSVLVHEDAEYGLYSVTMFHKSGSTHPGAVLCFLQHRFIVRDFTYDPKAIAQERHEKSKLEMQLKKQFGPLMNWLKVNFSQAFSAWIHLKALRVFTESVLRYSLPVNFQAVVMKPNKKAQKKLTETLNQLYGHLDSRFIESEAEQIDMPGLAGLGQQDYHPYVFFKVNLNLLEKSSS
ncbi:V-type proton ATPase subunit C [Geodia barretti]|uniref:V-type proton ATPase subunit C n=1 Tax=Geodia barretti TaxID=519541 RepID=A0AA35SBW4_GEOBA|nr:V-type proton ATPase subunit C [Geodia barretti]